MPLSRGSLPARGLQKLGRIGVHVHVQVAFYNGMQLLVPSYKGLNGDAGEWAS